MPAPVFSRCLLLFAALPTAINSRATVVSGAASDPTELVVTCSLCVCLCCVLYLAQPDEARSRLRGETLDPVARYWCRQPIPSVAAINFITRSPQFRLHCPGVRFTSHCASGAACLHPLLSRHPLMGRPISPVRGTSGNLEARRKKQRGGVASWGLLSGK